MLLGVLACLAIVGGALRNRANQRKIGLPLEDGVALGIRLLLICGAIIAVTLLMASGRPGTSFPVSGMMFVARSTASGPSDGVGWELDAIAAVFIGGAAVSGGVGTVVGSIIGGLVMAVLNNGLSLLGVSADVTQIIKGLVLLAAVAFDVFNKMQGRPSIIGHLTRNAGSRTPTSTAQTGATARPKA